MFVMSNSNITHTLYYVCGCFILDVLICKLRRALKFNTQTLKYTKNAKDS